MFDHSTLATVFSVIKIVGFICYPQPAVQITSQHKVTKFAIMANFSVPLGQPGTGKLDPVFQMILQTLSLTLCSILSPHVAVGFSTWQFHSRILRVQVHMFRCRDNRLHIVHGVCLGCWLKRCRKGNSMGSAHV